jgi:hypothetical protein
MAEKHRINQRDYMSAQRAHRDLSDAAATVDAASDLTSLVLSERVAVHLVHHSIRLIFGAVALVLRRFEDDWGDYIRHLFPKAQRPPEATDLLKEIKNRKLRDVANVLVAHSRHKGQKLPLSAAKQIELIKAGGWTREDELLAWYSTITSRLLAVRNAVAGFYPGCEQPEPGARTKT